MPRRIGASTARVRRPVRGAGAATGTVANPEASAAVLAELAKHLVAASKQAQSHGDASGAKLVRQSPAEAARLKTGFERAMRIETGRRARRLPYLATAATMAAGYTAWGAVELAQAAAGPAGQAGTVAGTAGLCAAALGGLRIFYRHGIDPRWQRRWWTAGLGAAGWVSTAAAVGPNSWLMSAALAAGAAATSTRWLRAHEVPDPGAVAPPPAIIEVPTEEDLGEVLAQRWADAVGRQGGVVPGALLTGRGDLPNAIRWVIHTPPGTVSFGDLLGRQPRIAAGLRQPAARVILEPGDDESTAVLSVITRDVLADGVPYPGPRYGGGRIPLGPYADGTGEAEYVAYDHVGCRNGMATGEPGSGKSAFLEAVALGLKASGEWYVLFGDGDPEGGSSPLLNQVADWAEAGPVGVLTQLEALEAALEVRGMLKSTLTLGPDGHSPVPISDPTTQVPLREMRPCSAYPGIKWILDELHRLTKDPELAKHDFAHRLERLVRIGRKYGIVVLTGSQSLLVEDYGNRTPLRGMLSARNCFAFRNGNKTESAVVAGLRLSPAGLPPGGGYAFATGTGRLSMLRVAWARDMGRHAAALPATVLDGDTHLALAPYRPEQDRDPATLYATATERLRQWRTGQTTQPGQSAAVTDGQPARPDKTGGRPVSAGRGPVSGGLGGIVIPSALTADNVIPIRAEHPDPTGPVATGHPDRIPAAAPQDGPDSVDEDLDLDLLNDSQRCVHDALASLGRRQPARTGQLVDLTGLRAPAVSKALARLGELGYARKLAHGAWVSTTSTHSEPMNSRNDGEADDETGEEETA
jgi:hypothetical protein